MSLFRYSWVDDLEKDLGIYDKIFLVLETGKKSRLKLKEKLTGFCNSEELCNSRYKIKIFSSIVIPVKNNVTFVKIGNRDALKLKELYNMYEFSDKFSLLFGENCVGDIWNYVDEGIFTEKEAFAAFLH